MSTKNNKIIITFNTISQAMKMEKILKRNKIPGKLAPIPREISAGCGISWISNINFKNYIINIIEEHEIFIENIYEI